MKKSIKKNYIYNVAYQLLLIILPIITTPYLARTLGANGTGTYGYTVSIVTYFILFGSLGLSLYGQREIAYVQNDHKKRSTTFIELVIFRVITILFSAIIYYFLFARSGEYSLYYKILILDLIASGVDISWFFQGIEDFKKIVFRNLVIKFLSIVSIFTFIHTPDDLCKYILIYALSNVISNVFLWIKINKYIDFSQIKNIHIKKHIKPVLILFFPQIAIQVYTVLDKTMIGFILNDMSEVGYYEQSQKIIKMVLTIITSIGTVMLPRIANFYANGEHDKIEKYMYRTFNFIYMLSLPMILGLIAVTPSFVPLFFGNGYDKVIPIMRIMSLIILFIGFSGVIGNQYLLTTKMQKEFTLSVICGCIINFLLNIIFIINFKSIGATIATVIAEFSVTAIQFWFIRKKFNIKSIIKMSKNYLLSGLIMFICCLFIDTIVTGNFVTLFLQVLIGTFIYFMILILLKDNLLLYFINSLCKRFTFIIKIKNKTIDKLNNRTSKIILIILMMIICLLFPVKILISHIKNMDSTNLRWDKYGTNQVLGDNETGTLFDSNEIID